jgi:hypothetical protein
MSDGGYTLAEMLAALVMVSLAVSGLALATGTISRAEARSQAARATLGDLGRLHRAAAAMLGSAGPFIGGSPRDLQGDGRQASFPCNGGQACRLALEASGGRTAMRLHAGARDQKLALRGVASAELRYVSALDGRTQPAWPPADRPDRLAAVVLFSRGAPLDVLRISREQPAACVFDVRLQGCAPMAAQR